MGKIGIVNCNGPLSLAFVLISKKYIIFALLIYHELKGMILNF